MSFFGSFLKKDSGNHQAGKWQVGDKIANRYEIYQILGGEGKSGMGIVYICHDHKTNFIVALKTFQEKYLFSKDSQELFEREALIWTELEKHSYIVHANWVEKLEDRLFIILEYVSPDKQRRNTLTHYLNNLTLPDILKFSIQFCYGMEYIYSKGVDVHRDVKPDNIMITPDQTVKITDFGLTKAFQEIQLKEDIISSSGRANLSIFQTKGGKRACGTLQYMAPEQFDGYADKRSDIYSFGITLYQMVTGGQLPFIGKGRTDQEVQQEYERLHKHEQAPSVSSPLSSVIQRCLEKEPDERFQDFAVIRGEIEKLLSQETGETVSRPRVDKVSLEAWELTNKGLAFYSLGKYQEAIACYDKAMESDPGLAGAPTNKGNVFFSLGKYEEAITYYDKAIEVDPGYALAWNNKGGALSKLGKYEEAITYYDKAIKVDPGYTEAWHNKGVALGNLSRFQEAITCYDKEIELNPRGAEAWFNKGVALGNLSRFQEAITCYDKVIELNPRSSKAWFNKGVTLRNLGRFQEAITCYDKSIEINSRYTSAWNNKGAALASLGKYQEALRCAEEAIKINPNLSQARELKQIVLQQLRR